MIENTNTEIDTPSVPERMLMVKLLKLAVDDLKHPKGTLRRRTRLQNEAKRWFLTDDLDENGKEWPFSFTGVCERLELNPETIRERLGILEDIK